jgi:D-arabinose 1-dehydrogenase-like Zn-dependent alcohol dehydrogenase
LQAASGLCKQLFKSKLKQSPDIAEASSKRYRLRLMADSVFCAQRNLAQAFHMKRENFQQCIKDANKKRIRVVVRHPLGKITCAFDKKNSEKIKGWLGASAGPAY